jgi:hypothetical protein
LVAEGRTLAPEHVLAAALLDRRVAAALAVGGATTESLRAELLAAAGAGGDLAETMRRAQAIADARGAAHVSLGDLLRALRERGGRLAELTPAELHELDDERAVDVAGRAPLVEATDSAVDVFAINDPETTMAAVVAVLRGAFGHPPDRAAFAMLEAHEKGHGWVGRSSSPRSSPNRNRRLTIKERRRRRIARAMRSRLQC